jgi:hypothetical protein
MSGSDILILAFIISAFAVFAAALAWASHMTGSPTSNERSRHDLGAAPQDSGFSARGI